MCGGMCTAVRYNAKLNLAHYVYNLIGQRNYHANRGRNEEINILHDILAIRCTCRRP